ncbi:hypothetical protein ABZ570_11060 [Micromonospora sp. NPDC007271]
MAGDAVSPGEPDDDSDAGGQAEQDDDGGEQDQAVGDRAGR